MNCAADIIEKKCHSSFRTPRDLAHLLTRLRTHHIGFSPLIRYHASHEEEDVKCALFVRMLGRLKSLMENDPPLYGTILKVIESIPDSSVAKNGAAQHHLHNVVRHTQGRANNPKLWIVWCMHFLFQEQTIQRMQMDC